MSKRITAIENNINKLDKDIEEMFLSGIKHQRRTISKLEGILKSLKKIEKNIDCIISISSIPPNEMTSSAISPSHSDSKCGKEFNNNSNTTSLPANPVFSNKSKGTETSSVSKEFEFDYKEIISNTTKILKKLCQVDSEHSDVKRLAKLIYHWYTTRILYKYEHFNRFKYNPQRINTLIKSIVLTYGSCCTFGRTDDFYNEFMNWIDKLGKDKKITENYGAPAIVSNFEVLISDNPVHKKVTRAKKYVNSFDFTVAAIILWDELYSKVLNELNSYHPKIFSDEDAIFEIVSEHNPKAAEEYQDVYGTANFDYADYNIS